MALGRTGPALDALRAGGGAGGPVGVDGGGARIGARAHLGDTEEAEQMLVDLQRRATEDYVSPMTIAVVYASFGRFEEAVAAVEQVVRGSRLLGRIARRRTGVGEPARPSAIRGGGGQGGIMEQRAPWRNVRPSRPPTVLA